MKYLAALAKVITLTLATMWCLWALAAPAAWYWDMWTHNNWELQWPMKKR